MTHRCLMVLGLAWAASAGCAPAPPVTREGMLSTDRATYLLHEPVELRIDSLDRRAGPHEMPKREPLWLLVSQPGGAVRRIKLWQDHPNRMTLRMRPDITSRPGEIERQAMWVLLDEKRGWIFPHAGRWRLGVESIASAPVEIEVVEPPAGEAKRAAELFVPKAWTTFLLNGYDDEDAESILKAIVDRYPRTTFGLFAAWTLVMEAGSHSYWVDEDEEEAKRQAEEYDAWLALILQAPEDHPVRPAAMWIVAWRHISRADHQEQAKQAMEALAGRYPWSLWVHSLQDQFRRYEVAAKLAPYSDDPAVARRRGEADSPAGQDDSQ